MIEAGALPANPFEAVKWMRPRTLKTVDPRTVVSTASRPWLERTDRGTTQVAGCRSSLMGSAARYLASVLT